LRDQEDPSKKGSFVTLDDEDSDETKGGRIQWKPGGRRMEKNGRKKKAESASFSAKISKLMKSKESVMSILWKANWHWLRRSINSNRPSGRKSNKPRSATSLLKEIKAKAKAEKVRAEAEKGKVKARATSATVDQDN
jgi:hypothetical protein